MSSEDGQLVGHVEVCISVFVAKNSTSISCIASTDKDGEFQIENVKFGTYGLLAVDEGEGYSITNQSPARDVVVTAAKHQRTSSSDCDQEAAFCLAPSETSSQENL